MKSGAIVGKPRGARPESGAVLKPVEFVKGRDYPERGKVVDRRVSEGA